MRSADLGVGWDNLRAKGSESWRHAHHAGFSQPVSSVLLCPGHPQHSAGKRSSRQGQKHGWEGLQSYTLGSGVAPDLAFPLRSLSRSLETAPHSISRFTSSC